MMKVKEIVFRSVSAAQVTPIFVLLATGTLIAILLLKVELLVRMKTIRTRGQVYQGNSGLAARCTLLFTKIK
jgi:hypothetical protein